MLLGLLELEQEEESESSSSSSNKYVKDLEKIVREMEGKKFVLSQRDKNRLGSVLSSLSNFCEPQCHSSSQKLELEKIPETEMGDSVNGNMEMEEGE